MTCIVGLVAGGAIYMGADSASVSGSDMRVRFDRKIFRKGDFVIGFTSSYRMGQLLTYSFEPPVHDRSTKGSFEYMVTHFVDAVRDCLKEGGFATCKDEAEHGGTFMVGYAGSLFKIDEDYSVAESADPFDACGSGEDYALAALFVTEDMTPEKRIRTALHAAEHLSTTVRGPYQFETLGLVVKDAKTA